MVVVYCLPPTYDEAGARPNIAHNRIFPLRVVDVPCVLVVDDDPDIRRMLEDVLTDEGHQVRVASNGREALAFVEHQAVDLILLDLMMPVMDGPAFYQAYRARVDNDPERAPVVVISADRNVREQAAQLGVDSYLTKPFDLDALLDQVERFTA